MQTFLPYQDFEACAKSLDQKRLGKQRVENLQILEAMSGYKLHAGSMPRRDWRIEKRTKMAWQNHPCLDLWRGHEKLFRDYQYWITTEWISRGYTDTCWEKFNFLWNHVYEGDDDSLPDWYGDLPFHQMFQSLLRRKDPGHYNREFPGVPDSIPFNYKFRSGVPIA